MDCLRLTGAASTLGTSRKKQAVETFDYPTNAYSLQEAWDDMVFWIETDYSGAAWTNTDNDTTYGLYMTAGYSEEDTNADGTNDAWRVSMEVDRYQFTLTNYAPIASVSATNWGSSIDVYCPAFAAATNWNGESYGYGQTTYDESYMTNITESTDAARATGLWLPEEDTCPSIPSSPGSYTSNSVTTISSSDWYWWWDGTNGFRYISSERP
jgi:hypothetical protein